uniref:Uncharacterized protein n=1 Tax=Rhizophora mucronata TaxID=61149 RepID=A0A2P2NSR3_RHIMU
MRPLDPIFLQPPAPLKTLSNSSYCTNPSLLKSATDIIVPIISSSWAAPPDNPA